MSSTSTAARRKLLMERPALSVGLVGYDGKEELRLREAIASAASGQVIWRVGSFATADAWLVNGSRTRPLADGDLLVAAGLRGRSPVQFSLSDIDRPIAFSGPLATPDFEPALRFDRESQASIHQMLARFVFWLKPLASQLCLAAQLIEHEDEIEPGGVYHVNAGGRLLAVVDLRGDAGVLRSALPADFDNARWSVRPSSARYIPESFERTSMSVLMWQYALRTDRNLLPERYRETLIFYRRPPRLPHRLLGDSHLRLLRDLAARPATFYDLRLRTEIPAEQLARDLAALYLVGSITTNRARVRNVGGLRHHGFSESRNSGWPSQQPADASLPRPLTIDHTVPAPIAARSQ
jgi:hypothetical protein